MTSGGRWVRAAVELLERLVATQDAAIQKASVLCADAIAAGRLVHLFGTGHSRMAVEEMFPRYGSYPGFHPIVELSTTFHTQVVGANGQRQAMFIERVEGLAEVILSNFDLRPPDVMVVFSASGLNGQPHRDGDGRPRPRPAGRGRHLRGPVHGRRPGPFVGHPPARPRRRGHRPGHPGRRRPGLHRRAGRRRSARAHGGRGRRGQRDQGADGRAAGRSRRMPPVLTSAALVGPDESSRLFDEAYREHARRSSTHWRLWR